MRKASLQTFALVLGAGVASCTALPDETPPDPGTGGTAGSGGTSGAAIGGSATGGNAGTGSPNGGSVTGGSSTGGAMGGSSTGGAMGGSSTGGAMGGSSTGGAMGGTGGAVGGNATGGAMGGTGGATGGKGGSAMGGKGGSAMGGAGAGGKSTGGGGAGGAGSGGGGGATQAPDCNAQMPSGGTQRSGNGTGGTGNLAWEIWSNTGQGNLTTYSVPAFIATWNNAGGYLGRLGYEWGNNGVPHTQRGTITAQFVARKTGSAGGYSYIGMYGWTNNPCVEWYVVDDNFGTLPFNPGGTTNRGEVSIDGGSYIVYLRPTTGTGGSRCSGVSSWNQYYSIRRTARACGVISLTQHFNAWQAAGLDMTGNLLEAKILVEVGGGVGNVQLPVANVILQ